MAKTTNRVITDGDLQLILPQGSEPVDIEDLNYNFQEIAAYYSSIAGSINPDVYWDNIQNIPTDLAYKSDIMSEDEVKAVIDDYIGSGSEIHDTLEGMQANILRNYNYAIDHEARIADNETELADHESRIQTIEDKIQEDIGLFVENGIMMCRYEVD